MNVYEIYILQFDLLKKGQCPLCHNYKNNLYMYICEQLKNITISKSGGGVDNLTCAQPLLL